MVTDQVMDWGTEGRGREKARKTLEVQSLQSLDSPALILYGLQGHLIIPVPVGHQGQRPCCPSWQRVARQEKQQAGRQATKVAQEARQHFMWTAAATITDRKGGWKTLWSSRKIQFHLHATLEQAMKSC